MPCADYPSDYSKNSSSSESRRLKKRLDNFAKILCAQCKLLDETNGLYTPELNQWWTAHKEEDQKRKQAIQKKREEERQKKMAQYLRLKSELEL